MNYSEKSGRDDITLRAIILGLILVPINAYWVGISSEQWYCMFTLVNPFSNAIFTLTFLITVGFFLRRISSKLALSPAELLVIYVMVTMVSTISGHTTMTPLLATLTQPYWFATPENEWQSLFWQYIPSWMTVSDMDVLSGYFTGESGFHVMENMKAWLVPVMVWSAFIFFLYFSLLCISSILRKQWTENEKLSYPIIQLPLAMAADRKFYKTKLMWIGLAVAGSIRFFNGIHDLVPAVPSIPYTYRIDQFVTEKPWNAIGYVTLFFNLGIVGLTYFMPLNLSFSCWFFFWLTRFERVFASAVGWNQLYLNERASGAWIGVALIALWLARRHLVAFGKHLLGLEKMDDSKEPMRYRTAAIMLVVCLLVLVLFCRFAGMSIWAILVFFAIYILFAIAIARVRAELGPPYHEVVGINPRGIMVQMFGSRRLLGNNLTIMSFIYPFNRCNRAHPMPCQIEAFKIAERTGMNNKRLVQAILLAVGFGAIASFWSYLHFTYHYGTLGRLQGWIGNAGWEVYNPLQAWLQYPQGTDVKALQFMGGGFLFVTFLHIMRTRFLWWPLYPSGYVLSGGAWGGMVYFWFPVMVSWMIKSIILKYGGIKTHRKATFFFLGLVLGDFTLRSIWSIVSLVFKVYMPSSGAGWN
ncbi:hypothetical protein GF312_21260 [Candidatus Poribacteria bacterium]|nr:hypothetical protein [Candidatus Poribacteria bacterium]